jgi:hypothetical protein
MKTLYRDATIDTRTLMGMLDHHWQGSSEEISDDSFHRGVQVDIEQVKSIYVDQHQLFEPLILISRALTDSHFGKFLLKIPSIFTRYNAKCQKNLTELDIRVKGRIRDLYWGRYKDFREAFNLKLNYSLKLESARCSK